MTAAGSAGTMSCPRLPPLAQLSAEPAHLAASAALMRGRCLIGGRDVAVVTDPDLVRQVLTDHVTWSSAHGPGLAHARPGGVLTSSDPPAHTEHRALLSRVLRAAGTGDGADLLRREAAAAAARLRQRGRADVVADLAGPLAAGVVARLLGLRPERARTYWTWALHLAEGLSGPAGSLTAGVVDTYRAFHADVSEQIRNRRDRVAMADDAAGDLLTRLLRARLGGRALTPGEVLGFSQFMLVGGSVTTALLAGNVIDRLLDRPEQLEAVRSGRIRVADAVEESLRLDAPLIGFFRTSPAPADVAGMPLAAREKLLVLFATEGLRGRDDPLVFDAGRAASRHLAFGHGVHYCLGAALARAQATAMVDAVLEHWTELRRDGPARRVRAELLHGPESLPVAWPMPGDR